MSYNANVSFIGGGNMAGAIIDAILNAQVLSADKISVYDPSEEKRTFFKEKGLNIAASNIELSKRSDVLFLAVKPQMIDVVLEEIAPHLNCKCIVSIAAGISTDHIKKFTGEACPVIRALPNTPMLALEGMTVIAQETSIPDELFDFVHSIFKAAGEVVILPENKINEAIPLSSSSPAFFFRMLHAMASFGEKSGIAYEDAFKLAAVSMSGSARYALKSKKTPAELIRQVSSPGGTTVAALTAFDDIDFESFITEASKRCVSRAYELGKASDK